MKEKKEVQKPKMTEKQVYIFNSLCIISLIVKNYIYASLYIFLAIMLDIRDFHSSESLRKSIEKLLLMAVH